MNLKISFHKIISTLLLTTLTLSLTSFTEFNIASKNSTLNVDLHEINFETLVSNELLQPIGGIKVEFWRGTLTKPTSPARNADVISTANNLSFVDHSTSTTNRFLDNSNTNFTNTNFYVFMSGYITPNKDREIWLRIFSDDGIRIRFYKNKGDSIFFAYNDFVGQGAVDEFIQAYLTNSDGTNDFLFEKDVPFYFEIEFNQGSGPWALHIAWSETNSSYENIPDAVFTQHYPIPSKIIFDNDNNSSNQEFNSYFDKPLPSVDIPTKTGFDFVGYFNDDNVMYYDSQTNKVIANHNTITDLLLTAQWVPTPLTITYDSTSLAGATTTNPTNFDITTNTINLSGPTTRIGYTFEGWYDALEGGNEITNIPQGSTASLTLYARWELKEHKIRFFDYPNFIEFDQFDLDYGVSTDSITYPNLTLTNGFEFVQWQPTLPSNMPDEDILLYPVVKRKIINNYNFQINSLESNYLGGYIVVDLNESDSLNYIFIDSLLSNPSSPTEQQIAIGAISIYTNPNTQVVEIYYGTGTSVTRFGYIDNSLNGLAGNKLKIYFENSVLLNNGNFEQPLSTGWTVTNTKIELPGDAPLKSGGQFLTSIINNSNNSTYGLNNIREIRGNVSSPLLNHSLNTSNYARLYTKGTIEHLNHQYNWKIHGPQIVSDVFSAKPGDTIKFDWRAINLGDVYDIRAFLINGDTNTEVSLLDPSKTTGLPNISTNWATETLILSQQILPSASNNLRFKFIGGGDDATRFGGIEAEFHIDNIKIEDPLIPGSVINDLIKALKYQTKLNSDKAINITTYNSANERLDYFIGLPNGTDNFEAIDKDYDLRFIFNQDEPINISLDLATHFIEEENFNNTFVISSSAKPNFLTLNNNKLTGVGLNSDVGNQELVFTANIDEQELYTFGYKVLIQIVNINDAPVYNSSKYPSFKVPVFLNQDINYQLPSDLFNDIDVGDVLTYTVVSGKPSCISISGSGLVTGTCSTTSGFATGTVIRVTDNGGITAQTTITFSTDVEVRFNTNGGFPQPANQNVVFGEKVTRPETDPIKAGYRFDGWYSDINTNILYNFNISQNIDNLYAKWTLETYNLNYSLNGGTHSNPTNYTYLTPTFILNNPIRSHYNFAGWYTNPNYTGDQITQFVTGTYGDFNLYAKWTPIVYNINYFNLDETLNNPIRYTIETNINLIEPVSSTGRTFLGFYNNPQFSGERITNIPRGTVGNIDIYASWFFSVYYLRFYDGENLINEFPLTFNSETLELQPPTDKEGHTFVNWSSEIPSRMPNRSIDIFANYTINEYKLTIKNTLDEEVIEKTLTFGEELISHLPVPEEVEGYTLIGFETLAPEKMPASDLELNIVYEVKQFNLILSNSLGETVLEQLIDFNADLSIIDLEPKEIKGYEFDSWSLELPEKMPASDLTLVALYNKLSEFELVFIGIDDVVISTSKFSENQSLSEVVLPNLSNDPRFDFEGWDKTIPDVMPNEKVEIRALGRLRTVELTLLNEDLTVFDTIIANVGQNKTLPTLELLGYNFLGWRFGNSVLNSINAPISDADLIAVFEPKVYVVSVTIGSRDLDIGIAFNQPVGQLPQAALFGYVFEGWKQYIDGPFIDANTTFNDVDNINLVPVFRRLNAVETLIATPGFIIDLILSYID